MRDEVDHLMYLGCIRRGSVEENKMAHEDFNLLQSFTNKRKDYIAQQLLLMLVDLSVCQSNEAVLSDQSPDSD